MRLADLGWSIEDISDNEFASVYHGKTKYTVGRNQFSGKQWWYGYNINGFAVGPINYLTVLELACWLADKEPAE